MPKIIKDLPNKIVGAARDLFEDQGYDNVDMASIAAKAGIAVGTIYNYYKTKMELFVAVMERGFEDFEKEAEDLVSSGVPPEEKLVTLLAAHYRFVQKRAGLWVEMMRSQPAFPSRGRNMKIRRQNHLERIERVVRQALPETAESSDFAGRMALALLMTVVGLVHHYPQEHNENRAFIAGCVRAMLADARRETHV